ncbi:hypothetical protein ACEYYB_08730 [Paracoccus sp. p4-l81]|uniref:hypothetical protein n=1 Tax=unclassified Paracoccus (in: a-proteobacteria) TaxID=2688777 RepID=UPI0035BAD462
MDYSWLVIIHLFCAIVFAGAVVTEVLAVAPLRRKLPPDVFQQVEFHLFRRIRRVYPLFVLPLFITGGVMFAHHLTAAGGWAGLWGSRFGVLLSIKAGLALMMLAIFVTAPFIFLPARRSLGQALRHLIRVEGQPSDFRSDRFDGLHLLALALVSAIVLLAKLMFLL